MKEVENLTNERQLLLNQIKSDTEKLTSIQEDLETKYEGKLMTRDQRIQELELELDSRNSDNANLRSELEKLKEDNGLLSEEVDTLKFDLRRVESNFEKGMIAVLLHGETARKFCSCFLNVMISIFNFRLVLFAKFGLMPRLGFSNLVERLVVLNFSKWPVNRLKFSRCFRI